MTKIRSRDASRIEDRRGQGGGGGGLSDLLNGGLGGGGGGMPLPGGLLKGGGGLVGILIMAAVFILPKLLSGGMGAAGLPGPAAGAAGAEQPQQACSTDLEQAICGATNDVAEYWVDQLPLSFGIEYQETKTVFFSGVTTTGCGRASSQTGPFYCPLDNKIYFDLDFLTKLQKQFGATGDLAAQYIVAHEYGHHIQNVLGINAQMRKAQKEDPRRANQYSVALELQADCLAGAWASDASARNLFDNPQEVEEALNAAAAVGDDAIQMRTQGRITPENWTHGSSAQRVEWFKRGYETGDPQRCTTFAETL